MDTKFIEAGQALTPEGGFNWGKFMVGRFTDDELAERSAFPGVEMYRLINSQGWSRQHIWICDLATGEGAMFCPGGMARSDLRKHKIWVCVLYEEFLVWLYDWIRGKGEQWWDELPRLVELPEAEFDLYGYRRPGPEAS